jgi:hypothetical protein
LERRGLHLKPIHHHIGTIFKHKPPT